MYIKNAAGNLEFRSFSSALTIDVQDSPDLELLSFPNLQNLFRLQINNAPSLTNISLPQLSDAGYHSTPIEGVGVVVASLTVNITHGSSLTDINFGSITALESLLLTDLGANPLRCVDLFNFIVTASDMVLSGCYSFPELRFLNDLNIAGDGLCPGTYDNLVSVENLILTNATANYLRSSISVNGSLIIKSLDYSHLYINSVGQKFSTVGSDVNVTSNMDGGLEFTQLETIGGNLSVHNNTNCALGFDKLSKVAALSMIDNTNTSIPWFPTLQRADSIHLRGYIDT